MKKIIIIILLTFCVSNVFAQQYTPMTAAGYQMKRLKVDSTLHIPSFCGIPTTRNSIAKEGAIAMDTCNNLLYTWTNANGWNTIAGSGGSIGYNGLSGTDSISLGGVLTKDVIIYGKHNFNIYGQKTIDINAFGRGEIYLDSEIVYIGAKYLYLDTDSTTTSTADTSSFKPLGYNANHVVRSINSWPKTDTTSLSNRINLKVNISDTATMLSKYLRKTDTSAMLLPYLRKIDTTAMLSKYLRKIDTASLSNRINLKLNIADTTTMLSKYLRKIDTTNRFVNNVTKKNDSTITVFKGSTATDILLPRGSSGSGTVISVATGYGLTGGPITSTGILIVDSATLSGKYLRKSDTAAMLSKYLREIDTTAMLLPYLRKIDTTAMLLPYLRKIDTTAMLSKYLRRTDTTAMLSPYLRKIDTTNKWVNNVTKVNDSTIRIFKGNNSTDIELPRGSSGGNGTVTNIATGYGLTGGPISITGTIIIDSSTLSAKYLRINDTTSMLSKYLREIDTASLSNRINLKLNISDTSTMLSKYLRKTDTASLSNRINLKLNISDTSNMLNSYLRKIDTTNKFVNDVTKINDSTIRIFKGSTSNDLLIRGNASGGGSISGTINRIPKFTSTSTLGNSTIQDDGTGIITINTTGLGDNIIKLNSAIGSTNNIRFQHDNINQFILGQGDNDFILNSYNTSTGSYIGNVFFVPANSQTFGINNLTPNTAYSLDVTGKTLLRDLVGTGNRMVITTSTGELQTQAIPTGGSGTVTSVATGYGLSGGTITNSGTLLVDSATLSNKYLRITDGVPYTGATSNLNMGEKNVTANAYFNGFTSMIAAGTTVILTVDSTPVHLVTTGSGSQTYQLPNATTLTNGTIFSFNNNQSSGNINVNNNSGTLVKAVGSGGYMILELLNNTTAAGTWDSHFQTPSNVSWSTNTFDYGGSITSAQWNGTTVAYNRGGTGQSSLFTQGGVAFGSTTTALGTTAAGTSGQMLVSAGTGTPTWADTSVFQRKNISAYSLQANNTASAANVTTQTYRDVAEAAISGTIAWVGTSAPSSLTSANYSWSQIGKTVTVEVNLLYANPSVAITAFSFPLPSDMPTPVTPTGWSAASNYLFTSICTVHATAPAITSTSYYGFIRRDAANTGYELGATGSPATARGWKFTLTYKAQ